MTALLANPALPGLMRNLHNQNTNALGCLGEQLCFHLLTARGYIVSNVHPGEHRGDLRVITPSGQILRVEVKTARRGKTRRWHFILRKTGKTDVGHSDVVILLCVMDAGYIVPFVIPTIYLPATRSLTICSEPDLYAGKYAQFQQHMHKLNLEVL